MQYKDSCKSILNPTSRTRKWKNSFRCWIVTSNFVEMPYEKLCWMAFMRLFLLWICCNNDNISRSRSINNLTIIQ